MEGCGIGQFVTLRQNFRPRDCCINARFADDTLRFSQLFGGDFGGGIACPKVNRNPR